MLELTRPHIAADNVEWLLVYEGRGEVSRGDLLIEAGMQVNPEDSDEAELADQSGKDLGTKLDTKVDDCLNQIAYRARALAGLYAFDVDGGIVKRGSSALAADAELAYKFLLACCHSKYSHKLSAAFVSLCKYALEQFIGERGDVWNIDAGSDDRKNLGSTTPRVVENLASKVGARIDNYVFSQLAPQGDGGCDLVATIDFCDSASGHLTILAQCAATSDDNYWRNKIAEPRRFYQSYSWSNDPIFAMFIPMIYRSTDGTWRNEANCSNMLMFDRCRILALLDLPTNPLPAKLRTLLRRAITDAFRAKQATVKVAKRAATKYGKKSKKTVPKVAKKRVEAIASRRSPPVATTRRVTKSMTRISNR